MLSLVYPIILFPDMPQVPFYNVFQLLADHSLWVCILRLPMAHTLCK